VVEAEMRKAREPSERLWRGTVSSLVEEGCMVRGRLYSCGENVWRTTRAKRFECYCREFETDTRVSVNAEVSR